MISGARFRRGRLYVVFVDFKKAFDTVRRDLLMERCREIGVHGQFLDLLVALYDRVCLRVAVGGEVGEPFGTHAGTKQGSELSPLLFGLFIELLHELIKLRLPGAGPVLGQLRVPDVMYADDVTLIANSPEDAQALLDVLDIFCRLFGMEVNLAPHKTCVVVFRRPHTPVPTGLRLLFRGQEIARQPSYIYLGVKLHETQGIQPADSSLAASGSKAMHALLTHLRRAKLTQFDIKTRMFDVLVEPVMSYAAHVWGPSVFHKKLRQPYNTEAEKVHLSFLRVMTGVGKAAARDVLYRDLHRAPILHHWVILAARWWNRLAKRGAEEQPGVAYHAWLSDLDLMLHGCKDCWAYHLLKTLTALRLVEADQWQASAGATLDSLKELEWDEDSVRSALLHVHGEGWQGVLAAGRVDPRQAPSAGLAKITHNGWVYPYEPDTDYCDRHSAPAYTLLCLPFPVLRNLAQLRIGWAHLEVDLGRMKKPTVPRGMRACRACNCASSNAAWQQLSRARSGLHEVVEDLLHFVMECPAYDDLRDRCLAFPATWRLTLGGPASAAKSMAGLFASCQQMALANTLYYMKVRRAELLGLQGCI